MFAPPRMFDPFFCRATGQLAPFDYQRRLAEGDGGAGNACVSRLIDVPTGCGKTAAVVLAWLWNRVVHPDPARRAVWPRRLVYCLPMRTLVEQTHDEVTCWLGERLWDAQSDHAGKVGLHVLMGGEEAGEWDAHPEADAVLIGTQDMLLSRALNRGYGMSRYRWPMQFGLLNNDCLWVMDETQLMGVGVETSAQLDAFRRQLGTQAACHCWWMSATLEAGRIETVDHPAPVEGWPRVTLGEAERENGEVARRYRARKNLAPSTVALASATAGDTDRYQKELAAFIAEKHVADTLTLVVVNRVPRAQAIYQQLAKSPPGGAAVALVHSRFRPGDRRAHEEILFDKQGGYKNRIVVATQAVEAGVDVSARTLVTELAPWSSLVQRFGRCNRYGECNDDGGQIFWADLLTADDKDTVPYTAAELAAARALLQTLTAAGPQDLQGIHAPAEPTVRPVIRRKDLLDLFDTTADLCGADLDVSRYVRDGDDTDVQVYWRKLADKESPSPEKDSEDRKAPERVELCRVSQVNFAKFLKRDALIWRWDALEETWRKPNPNQFPIPGAVYLLESTQGGYRPDLGWTGIAKDGPVEPRFSPGDNLLDGYRNNRRSFIGRWVELGEHVAHVVEAADELCRELALPDPLARTLHTAAEWHDAGKAHAVFQQMLTAGADVAPERKKVLWAKSDRYRGPARRNDKPSDFRHELASALLWLQLRAGQRPDGDLVAYLIGAHHGKVRLSLRALPNEEKPSPEFNANGSERMFARGVWQGDVLPAEDFSALEILGEVLPSTRLELTYMHLGYHERTGDSWLDRMVRLRDAETLGPFRLAFLETLLRVADWRASASEKGPL